MVTLANGFIDRGLCVDLVLAKAEGPYMADVSRLVRVVNLGASRVMASLGGLVRYLRHERPVALLSAMGHANVVAAVARRIARVETRLVISEHANLSAWIESRKSTKWRSMSHFMRWTYPMTDWVVAVSEGVAVDLELNTGVPRGRIQVIYNPVVTDTLLAQSRQPLEHPWFCSGAPPVVLGVGRLTAQKDFALLIRGFAELRAARDVRLMILGEGELRSELEALVRELGLKRDVLLPGFVANPYAYMRRAALYVLSSGWEGFGNVLAEAMACGAVVVSTDCPSGPAEILEDGKWGRLVPVGDVDALARAMAASLDEEIHPDTVSRAANFGVDQAVSSYMRLLLPGYESGLPGLIGMRSPRGAGRWSSPAKN